MIYVGKIVNTHGLKGEIRIISDLKCKDLIFKVDNELIIDNIKYIIKSYRKHKNYDMVTLNGIDDIDKALGLKNKLVYIERKNIDSNLINSDLIGYLVKNNDKEIGRVTDIIEGKQDIIVVNDKTLIPYVDEFINKIDIDNKIIYINVIEGLINEN